MAATLIKTVEAGDSALLAQLLADGADVNKKSAFSGNTALHAAAGAGQMEMVTTLLEHGANVDAALKHDNAGKTPLWLAVEASCLDVVMALLERGASANARLPNNKTPLFVTVREGDLKTALALLDHGADPNAETKWDGRTPLTTALEYFDVNMSTLLLQRGADPSKAKEELDADKAVRLVDAGVDPEILLVAAADKNDLRMARVLVENFGASGKLPSPTGGRIALQVGSSSTDPGVREYFKRLGRFCGAFDLAKRPEHKSSTSVVRRALDLEDNPVVIKFMANRDQFECEVHARQGLDDRFVVGAKATSEDLGADMFATGAEELEYGPYGVVLEAAERNLAVVMLQERLSVVEVADTMRQLATCLHHIHTAGGRIHGDFKPLNAMRMETGEWKLIDLDASAKIEVEAAGAKYSSAYSPPELAHRLFLGQSDLPPLQAHESFDVWSFGVVLYEMLSQGDLLPRNRSTDNVNHVDGERKLCMWRSIDDELLANVKGTEPAHAAARNLIAWCLQGNPADRPTMAEVLGHPFLAAVDAKAPPASGPAAQSDLPPAPPDIPVSQPLALPVVPRAKHVFISHFQAEAAGIVHTLYHALRGVGALPWVDMFEEDLTEHGMRCGVEQSDVFVLVLTANVLTREFCRKEIGWALAAGKPIVMVCEQDPRFAAFDYTHWRADELWDGQSWTWSVPSDPAKQPYQSLGGTAELRAIRDLIDRHARSMIPYRRRDFEQRAMIVELLRRAADPTFTEPPVVWRCPTPPPPVMATASPMVLCAVCHGPAGEDVVAALQATAAELVVDQPVQWTNDLAAASHALVVLTAGVLLAESPSSKLVSQVLGQRLRVGFMYLAGAWDFRGDDYNTATPAVQAAIDGHEAMTYRPAAPDSLAYEHRAMVGELLRRLARQ